MSLKTKGFLYGIIAAVTYGMNPLFALPLYEEGINTDTVLFYRYLLAIVMLAGLMKWKKIPFRIKKGEIAPLFILGLLFSFSSLFLFESYNYMDAGIASTILFVYPVMVAVIMSIFFKEKITLMTVGCIALALFGIGLLYEGPGGQTLSTVGIIFVLLSSLTYAIYMVALNKSKVREMPVIKLTFYALIFGIMIYVVRLIGEGGIQLLPTPSAWMNAFSLGLFPTVISLIMVTLAIQNIGSTSTAILGALEPVTAVFFGVLIFGEQLTPRICIGILLILVSVTMIIAGKPLVSYIQQRFRHSLPRN